MTTTGTQTKLSAEAVRLLQRRVKAFAATGTTNNAPTTYHR